MANKSKAGSKKRKSRVKSVRVISEISEHHCTPNCFVEKPQLPPKGLRRLSLGYVYEAGGVFYQPFGKGWLPVTGIELGLTEAGLVRIFVPAAQLHIHSPCGRTVAITTTEKKIRTTPKFHITEAGKKLSRSGLGLRKSQDFARDQLKKIIAKAPKTRKLTSGRGKGAPGQPRSEFSRKVLRLHEDGVPTPQIVELMIDWSRRQKQKIAGKKTEIRKKVLRALKLTHSKKTVHK